MLAINISTSIHHTENINTINSFETYPCKDNVAEYRPKYDKAVDIDEINDLVETVETKDAT